METCQGSGGTFTKPRCDESAAIPLTGTCRDGAGLGVGGEREGRRRGGTRQNEREERMLARLRARKEALGMRCFGRSWVRKGEREREETEQEKCRPKG